jgi:hypothetical protein
MRAANEIVPAIRRWAGEFLLDVQFSGSYAKGTAVSLGTDVDLFISLSGEAGTVTELYWTLFQFCVDRGLKPRAQNVSIRVVTGGVNVDLVPARRQKGSDDHSLYRSKKDSWVQTNVGRHIKFVTEARCGDEIRAMKVWRERYHVEWPSFYLELVTVRAGRKSRDASVAERVRAVLEHVAHESFLTARVMDPANTNNDVADDLDLGEKRAVMNAARTALRREWEQIIW